MAGEQNKSKKGCCSKLRCKSDSESKGCWSRLGCEPDEERIGCFCFKCIKFDKCGKCCGLVNADCGIHIIGAVFILTTIFDIILMFQSKYWYIILAFIILNILPTYRYFKMIFRGTQESIDQFARTFSGYVKILALLLLVIGIGFKFWAEGMS